MSLSSGSGSICVLMPLSSIFVCSCFTSYKNSFSLNNKCFCTKPSHIYSYKTKLPIYRPFNKAQYQVPT
jgi:hypothetical protein